MVFAMRLIETISTAQRIAMPTVQRLRFLSATPEVPALAVRPPPNMSDNPPPLPLCRRISRDSRTLRTATILI
mgnify:CR=1 FL=1